MSKKDILSHLGLFMFCSVLTFLGYYTKTAFLLFAIVVVSVISFFLIMIIGNNENVTFTW